MDAGAEARALAEHEPMLRAVARGYFPPAGYDRSDLEQEARLGALEGFRSYDGSTPLRSFLRLCANRQLVDLIQAAARLKRRREAELELDDDRDAGGPSALDAAIGREELRELVAAGGRLSELERRATFGAAAGYRYDELGDRDRIDNAAQRGRRRLRAELEPAAA